MAQRLGEASSVHKHRWRSLTLMSVERRSTDTLWPGGFRAALCIRVDVETVNCLLKGVPNLMELFDNYGFKATFFVPMGSDLLGRSIKAEDLPRYLRLEPLKKFGVKNILYGLLLPPPDIGKQHSAELRTIAECGHEVGLHGFDHAKWVRKIRLLPCEDVEEMFIKGYKEFTNIFGREPRSFASPGFMYTESVLSLLDRHGFLYGSDTRGVLPFWPRIRGTSFKTLQVPVTMPNLEELSWRGLNDREALMRISSALKEKVASGGLATILIHPSYEGLLKRRLFSALLEIMERWRDEVWVTTMEEVASWWIQHSSKVS